MFSIFSENQIKEIEDDENIEEIKEEHPQEFIKDELFIPIFLTYLDWTEFNSSKIELQKLFEFF